jgi:hypothetical protein
VRNVQNNFLVHTDGVPGRIVLPHPDQDAKWLPKADIELFDGLDAHNRGVIRQWLNGVGAGQRPSSAASAASRRR